MTDIKLISSMTTSEAIESVVYRLLTGGRYRRHIETLRKRLELTRSITIALLERYGFQIWHPATNGLFLWAKLPAGVDREALSLAAGAAGILLAPGKHFSVTGQFLDYLRFNTAHCTDPLLESFFAQCLHETFNTRNT